jgi:glucosylceramidase
MGWTPEQQRDFLKNDLGPVIKGSKFNSTKILMMDDQRFSVVVWSQIILGDPESAKYVDGIGLHWYANPYTPPFPLNVAHNMFPEYFMINTEACTGYLHFIPGIEPVVMGSWERAQLYAHNIIEDLNHWLTGWVEWNLILDMKGGPNWAGNMVDAPIIVDATVGEAYKQPMYYAMGHFSKFVTEDSIRISHSGKELQTLEVLSVLRPDNKVVLVIYNSGNKIVPLKIKDSQQEGSIMVDIEPNSINTIAYSSLSKGPEVSTIKEPEVSTIKEPEVSTFKEPGQVGAANKIASGIIPLVTIFCALINRIY